MKFGEPRPPIPSAPESDSGPRSGERLVDTASKRALAEWLDARAENANPFTEQLLQNALGVVYDEAFADNQDLMDLKIKQPGLYGKMKTMVAVSLKAELQRSPNQNPGDIAVSAVNKFMKARETADTAKPAVQPKRNPRSSMTG